MFAKSAQIELNLLQIVSARLTPTGFLTDAFKNNSCIIILSILENFSIFRNKILEILTVETKNDVS